LHSLNIKCRAGTTGCGGQPDNPEFGIALLAQAPIYLLLKNIHQSTTLGEQVDVFE
jgi:hypothetical protein